MLIASLEADVPKRDRVSALVGSLDIILLSIRVMMSVT